MHTLSITLSWFELQVWGRDVLRLDWSLSLSLEELGSRSSWVRVSWILLVFLAMFPVPLFEILREGLDACTGDPRLGEAWASVQSVMEELWEPLLSRGEEKFLVCTSLQESKKEIEKLGRPQSQQIHTQELLVRASSTALLISQRRAWCQRSQ